MQTIINRVKTAICAAAVLAFVSCTPAQAGTTNANSLESMCATLSEISGIAMKANQTGTPLAKMIEATNKVESDNYKLRAVKLRAVMKTILLDAYSYPSFNTKSFQDKAVVDFSNKTYLACMKHGFGLMD